MNRRMGGDKNYNITDVDQMAKLQDARSQRLDRPYLDGWNSQEFLDVYSRGELVIGVSIATFAIWQFSGWDSFVFALILMGVSAFAGYQFLRLGKNAIGSVRYFVYFVCIGLVFGVNWTPFWTGVDTAIRAFFQALLGGLI